MPPISNGSVVYGIAKISQSNGCSTQVLALHTISSGDFPLIILADSPLPASALEPPGCSLSGLVLLWGSLCALPTLSQEEGLVQNNCCTDES